MESKTMLPESTHAQRLPTRQVRSIRSSSTRLIHAVAGLAVSGILTDHRETSWASITFAGTRHGMTWLFCGVDAVEVGEAFIAALPDHEFRIPGCLVADATIVEVSSSHLPEPSMSAKIEILLLDEA
jgi:hypothetical protein